MCSGDKLPASVNYARGWGITLIVLGALNFLGAGNLVGGINEANWYNIPQSLAGLLSIVGGSYISCCCIANMEQDQRTLADNAMRTKTGFFLGSGSTFLFFIAFIGAVMSVGVVTQCANLECDLLNDNVDALPAGCVKSKCEEDYTYDSRSGRGDWDDNGDCIAGIAAASGSWAPNGNCDDGYNMFVTSETATAWREGTPGEVLVCAPLMCCTLSSTPPAGYVTVGNFTCDDPNDLEGCNWQPFCEGALPFLYGAVVWELVMCVVSGIFANLSRKANKDFINTIDDPNYGRGPGI